jgi:hypothetical protein
MVTSRNNKNKNKNKKTNSKHHCRAITRDLPHINNKSIENFTKSSTPLTPHSHPLSKSSNKRRFPNRLSIKALAPMYELSFKALISSSTKGEGQFSSNVKT